MQSSAAMQQSCTGGQGKCFFSVNKEEIQEENEEKVEEKENKQEEEDKIRITMWSSVAMLCNCTHSPKLIFSVNLEVEEITTTRQSSAAMQQTYTRGKGNCFFPVNKEEEEKEKEEDKEVEEIKDEQELEEEGGSNHNASFHRNAAELYSLQRQLFLHQSTRRKRRMRKIRRCRRRAKRRARMRRKRRRRRRRGRRKRGSKLQCKLPQQCSRVVLVIKAIISSPVNKEEEKEMEEEEEEKVEEEEENKHQKEEDEIRTTMQSSVAMPQSCIHGPKQLFLSSK